MLEFHLAQVYVKRACAAYGSPRYSGLREQANSLIQKLESEDEKESLQSLMLDDLQVSSVVWNFNENDQIKGLKVDLAIKRELREFALNLVHKQQDLVSLYRQLYDLELTDAPDSQAIVDKYAEIEDFLYESVFSFRQTLESAVFLGEGHKYALALQLLEVSQNLVCEYSIESAFRSLAGFKFQALNVFSKDLLFLSKLLIFSPLVELRSQAEIIETIDKLEALRKKAPSLITFLVSKITAQPDQYRQELVFLFKYIGAVIPDQSRKRLDALLGLKLHFHEKFSESASELVANIVQMDPVLFYTRFASKRYASHQPEDFLMTAAEIFQIYLADYPQKVAQALLRWVTASPPIEVLPYDIYPTLELLENFYIYTCSVMDSMQDRSAVVNFVYIAINHIKSMDTTFSPDLPFVAEIMEEYHRLHGSNFSLMNISPCVSEGNLEAVNQRTPSPNSPDESFRGRLASVKKLK